MYRRARVVTRQDGSRLSRSRYPSNLVPAETGPPNVSVHEARLGTRRSRFDRTQSRTPVVGENSDSRGAFILHRINDQAHYNHDDHDLDDQVIDHISSSMRSVATSERG